MIACKCVCVYICIERARACGIKTVACKCPFEYLRNCVQQFANRPALFGKLSSYRLAEHLPCTPTPFPFKRAIVKYSFAFHKRWLVVGCFCALVDIGYF